MIDHLMLMVKDKKTSQSFYEKLLTALGHSLIHEGGPYAGFGRAGHVPFWLKQAEGGNISTRVHVALSAASRSQVRKFYETALSLGAKSNGEPGLRPEHGDSYYAAFIYDLDGHNIEAVCYAKEET
ncbi:hypothetical protein AZI86_05310 [Bdellovibrio bacteriovorus]|uniref:VOC domain-containing protein n=1 Tax=Bdellovibrio bacteriovorus TaxID=959 RepID=A0A150WQI6_BDEBC|nr:VOC family protein [Bdellovibrio bacteriovorus]KYG66465.1 hypothetical protein AZI86_05310 [Bdellovibrio bacteriovorus]